jgi:hypothetical protein
MERERLLLVDGALPFLLVKPFHSATYGVLVDALISFAMIHAKICHVESFLLSLGLSSKSGGGSL